MRPWFVPCTSLGSEVNIWEHACQLMKMFYRTVFLIAWWEYMHRTFWGRKKKMNLFLWLCGSFLHHGIALSVVLKGPFTGWCGMAWVLPTRPFVLHNFFLLDWVADSCLLLKKIDDEDFIIWTWSLALCIWYDEHTCFLITFICKLVSYRRWKLETSCRSQVKMYLSVARTVGSMQTC